MKTNELPIPMNDEEAPLHRLVQHFVENMVQQNSAPLQYALTSTELSPEMLKEMYMVKLRELNTMSNVRNAIELHTRDLFSRLHMACYKAEDFLSVVIKQSLSLLKIPYTDILLKCDGCDTVVLDARKTSMILYNLISNSLIHSKVPEKIIEIAATMRGNDFIISVTDNGKGIPVSKRRHLFNTVADLSSIENLSANPLILGGMGLAVSRKAAREMNGDLVYVSTQKKTTFEIILPQETQSVLNEPVEFIADLDFALLQLATANLFYLEQI